MPRVPYYSGSIGSAVLPQSPVPQQPDYEGLANDVSRSIASAFGYMRDAKAQKELSRQRAAAAAVDEQKVAEARAGQDARSRLASTLDELSYRSGGPPNNAQAGTSTPPIAESYPYEADPQALAAAEAAAPTRLRQLAVKAYRDAAGAGGDKDTIKTLLPILQAFNLEHGDDGAIVQTNAALDGKYLGKEESPSLGRQDFIREDEQAHDMAKKQDELRMQKYGFDLEHTDRRYSTDVSAATSRANNAATVGESARAHDIEHVDRRRGAYESNYLDMLKFYTPERAATLKTEATPQGKKTSKVVVEKGRRQPAVAKPDPLGLR